MKIETLVSVDEHLFTVEPDGQQTLADIQNQLADQLNALKSTLLEQSARLPNFEKDESDQRSSVDVYNSEEAGGLHHLKDALEAALTDVEDARSGLWHSFFLFFI